MNYLYGTGLVLAALASAGEDLQQPFIQKAVTWLISRQNQDGGWGETCETYANPELRGRGESTASQTAWVIIGLTPVVGCMNKAVYNGIVYLQQTQQEDGTWQEPYYTGTGFPKVFYLRYDLYRISFP